MHPEFEEMFKFQLKVLFWGSLEHAFQLKSYIKEEKSAFILDLT